MKVLLKDFADAVINKKIVIMKILVEFCVTNSYQHEKLTFK